MHVAGSNDTNAGGKDALHINYYIVAKSTSSLYQEARLCTRRHEALSTCAVHTVYMPACEVWRSGHEAYATNPP